MHCSSRPPSANTPCRSGAFPHQLLEVKLHHTSIAPPEPRQKSTFGRFGGLPAADYFAPFHASACLRGHSISRTPRTLSEGPNVGSQDPERPCLRLQHAPRFLQYAAVPAVQFAYRDETSGRSEWGPGLGVQLSGEERRCGAGRAWEAAESLPTLPRSASDLGVQTPSASKLSRLSIWVKRCMRTCSASIDICSPATKP